MDGGKAAWTTRRFQWSEPLRLSPFHPHLPEKVHLVCFGTYPTITRSVKQNFVVFLLILMLLDASEASSSRALKIR